MRPKPKNLLIILLGVVLYVAWQQLDRDANEVAVMHLGNRVDGDRYARLWVVDDDPFVWIRAEKHDRYWIQHLRENPRIQLRRNGENKGYYATFFDDDVSRYQIDGLFEEKYGLAEEARSMISGRRTLPIRLQRL